MDNKLDANAAILAALTTLGEADAKAIAASAGLGYSTATKKLRGLADTGQVARRDTADGPAQWRRTTTDPDTPHTDTDADPTDNIVGDASDTAAETETVAGDGDPTATTDAPDRTADVTDEADTGAPTANASNTAEAASLADVAGDTDPGSPASAGAPRGRRRRPGDEPTPAETPTDADTAAPPRRRSGQLRGEVLAVLQTTPDAPFKVGEVAKKLDASQGAVANALTKLVHAGSARQVCEAPATFQAN